MRFLAVSVDLDEICCYSAIHGLGIGREVHTVYDVALSRIRSFAIELGLPVTLFVVGRDLDRRQNKAGLRLMVEDGHEIGNHSLSHLYDLTRRESAEQVTQIEMANERIREALGVVPVGFRAPGYTVTDALLDAVAASGMRYDSSVFPCPPYYAAKVARLASMKLSGRGSHAVLDTPSVLRAPTTPYRIGRPYWKPGVGLLELPIQVVGPLKVPFIGTTLSLLGPSAARLLARGLIGQPLVNLELHGVDFLEASDVPEALTAVQPDLRVPVRRKRETLSAVVDLLRGHDYATVRLDEASRAFS